MPGYIGYAPQFNPISLQDYLAVPNQIYQEQQAAADKVEQYQDQLSYYKNLLGDEGAREFADYDRLMSELGDDIYNQRTGNLISTSRKLRKILRDIGTKVDIAKTNRDKYQAMLDKDPSLIGELGSMYSWYKDPDQTPYIISGKDIETQIGSLTSNIAKSITPQPTGQFYGDPKNKQEIFTVGIPQDVIDRSFVNATSGNPQNQYESAIKDYLDSINYNDLPQASKEKVLRAVKSSMDNNSGFGYDIYDGLKYDNIRSIINNRTKITSKTKSTASGKKKEKKLAYQGVVSSRLPNIDYSTSKNGKKETSNQTVNRINAEIPDGAQYLTAQEAKSQYPTQFMALFAKNKVKGMELEDNMDDYDFYVAFDDFSMGIGSPVLYIEPKEQVEEEDKHVNQDLSNIDVSNIF